MSPSAHAPLSPSAAHRWMTCPASIRMTSLVTVPVESTSPWAAEGTTAHTVAELCARRYVLKSLSQKEFRKAVAQATKGYDEDSRADMLRHGESYAKYLGRIVRAHPGSTLMLEQRLPTGIPECWGTSDAVIITERLVIIVDYKYGTGIRVDAADNEQLMLYAVGALDEYGDVVDETEEVRLAIFQPRLDHYDEWTIPPQALRDWRDGPAMQAAEETQDPGAHFGPSEDACRFCPASGECRARMEAVLADDFGQDPDLLSPEEIGDLLDRKEQALSFWKALEETALRKAYSENVPLPGWKVVLSGGRRGISDVTEALEVLHGLGYTDKDVLRPSDPKLATISQLERLLGKRRFQEHLGALAAPPPGRPSLAREDDPRSPVSALAEAQKEFAE